MPWPWTWVEVPDELVGEDGWIVPEAMARRVRAALERTVGPVREPGRGSYALVVYRDRFPSGRTVEVAAGEWATGFHAVPRAVRDCLARVGDDGADPDGFAERALRVRYRTERGAGRRRPGRIDLAITATTRASSRGPDRAIHPPAVVACLAGDFLEALT